MLTPGQCVHIIGIGGAGLSAIARVMLRQGYRVSGSDLRANELTAALVELGAVVHQGHRAANLDDVDAVIISSAVPPDNPELVEARARRLPVYKRSDMLQWLMAGYTGIAVAGTHGKTTTTSMIVHILHETGRDPTYIVGGVVSTSGTNAGVGQGPYFVIEADEYDHMFLGLRPQVSVITNIEHDHPDLFPKLEDLQYAFVRFAALIPPGGLLVACVDDPLARQLAESRQALGWPVMTYSASGIDADWQAANYHPSGEGGAFTVHQGQQTYNAVLAVPGHYNAANALAALAVTTHLGVPVSQAVEALATFYGSGRRFEVRGQAGGVTVIDDYAHHPTAIRLTLAAARERYSQAGIWAVWQPHTYTRFRALYAGFCEAFAPESADHVLITDIYAAREAAPSGPTVRDIVRDIKHPDVRHTPSLADATATLVDGVRPHDVVIILSAGDAPQIGIDLLEALRHHERPC